MATKQTSVQASGNIGILGLLGLLFIGLKLTGYIAWSWWWVTAPLWGGLAIMAACFLVVMLVLAIKR